MISVLQFSEVKCKDCYKCVRYCPVKSISIVNHQAQIIEEDCILCGTCTLVCPQESKSDISRVPIVKSALKSGAKLIVSVAPSYAAYFKLETIEPLRRALMKLGFVDLTETAAGAYMVKTAYEKLMDEGGDTLVSSCCSTLNMYVKRHMPEAIPFMAPVDTPIRAHAKLLKREHPEYRVVFLTPCISKKAECDELGSPVDFVITFDEMHQWLQEEGIELEEQKAAEDDKLTSRLFAIGGGILRTMKRKEGIGYASVDGFDNCVRTLKDIVAGKLKGYFIEMNACEGSCIGGQSFRKLEASPVLSRLSVEKTAPEVSDLTKDFNVGEDMDIRTRFVSSHVELMQPTEKQIKKIMEKMGKHSKEDELNCSMCGYPSCRDKAIAVYFGRAEVDMCLPYMKARAESFSDKTINMTPNAIIAVDNDLRIQQVNKAACDIFQVSAEDVIGQPVSRVLDDFDFVELISNNQSVSKKKYAYLADYNVYVEEQFQYDSDNKLTICVMRNITQERQRKNQLKQAKMRAAHMADELSEKQQRVVHEIASLLGETAAETKVAITELKETILMGDEDEE